MELQPWFIAGKTLTGTSGLCHFLCYASIGIKPTHNHPTFLKSRALFYYQHSQCWSWSYWQLPCNRQPRETGHCWECSWCLPVGAPSSILQGQSCGNKGVNIWTYTLISDQRKGCCVDLAYNLFLCSFRNNTNLCMSPCCWDCQLGWVTSYCSIYFNWCIRQWLILPVHIRSLWLLDV